MRAGGLAAGGRLVGQELFRLPRDLTHTKANRHRVCIGDDRRRFGAGNSIEAVGPEKPGGIFVDLLDAFIPKCIDGASFWDSQIVRDFSQPGKRRRFAMAGVPLRDDFDGGMVRAVAKNGEGSASASPTSGAGGDS